MHRTGAASSDHPGLVCLGGCPLVDEQDGAGWASIQNNAILEKPQNILLKNTIECMLTDIVGLPSIYRYSGSALQCLSLLVAFKEQAKPEDDEDLQGTVCISEYI